MVRSTTGTKRQADVGDEGKPNNYTVWAWVSLLACWPTAIPALVYANRVNAKYRGEAEAAGGMDVKIGRRPRSVLRDLEGGEWVRWKQGDEIHPHLQARYLLFSNPFMEDRADVGIRFLTAYLRGARDYCDAFDHDIGKQELTDLLVRETGEAADLLTTMKPLGFSPNGVVDLARLAVELDLLRERSLVPSATTPHDVVDDRFAEEALQRLGPHR
jgi:NitT/TauT family transport system substrate-binding protein